MRLAGLLAAILFLGTVAEAAAETAAEAASETAAETAAPAAPDGQAALADLVVNGERRGAVEFALDDSGRPLVSSSLLGRELAGLVKADIAKTLAGGDRLVGADELGPLGIAVRFDEPSLRLIIEVSPSAMRPKEIGAAAGRPVDAPVAAIENEPFSLILGARLGADGGYRPSAAADAVSYAGALELTPSFRIFGLVAEGAASLSAAGGNGEAARADAELRWARLVYDMPGLGARATGGIVGAGGAPFQSGAELYGLSLAREPSFPGAKMSGASSIDSIEIYADADVTIEVNGVAARRLRLGRGVYRFSELPLASGLNEVAVRIEEKGEPPRIVRLGIPFDESILAPGAFDYSIALGSLRARPDRPFGAASAAVGIARGLKMGASAEADPGSFLGGLSIAASSPFGSVGVDAAASIALPLAPSFDPSYAARAYWRFSDPAARYAPRLGATAEYRMSGFAAPAQDPRTDASTWSFSGQVGQALPGKLGSLSAFGEARLADGSLEKWSASLGLAIVLAGSSALSLSGGYDWDRLSGGSPRATISLNASSSGRRNLSYRRDLVGGADSADLMISLDPEGKSSLDFSAQGLTSAGTTHEVEAAAASSGRAASVRGSASYELFETGGPSRIALSASASTTFAIAGGTISAAGSPAGAFAVLEPSRELGGERVELRPSGGMPVAAGGGAPPSALVGLTPYAGMAAAIEMPASPPDRRPSPGAVEIRPAYRSVAVIRVGAESSIAVRGMLTGSDGSPLRLMSGDLVEAGGSKVAPQPTFTDEDGVFECYALSPGPALILWGDGSSSSFTVPGGRPSEALYDIGRVAARAPAAAGGTP